MQKQQKLGFLKGKIFHKRNHSTVETDSYLIYCSSAHSRFPHRERAALVKLSREIHGGERERRLGEQGWQMTHVRSCALAGAGRDPVVLYN